MTRRSGRLMALLFLTSLWLGVLVSPGDAQVTTIETVPPEVDDEGGDGQRTRRWGGRHAADSRCRRRREYRRLLVAYPPTDHGERSARMSKRRWSDE
ncbi:MAG: hypothetical protein CM1200mP26_29320 [Acidimicrobiales bacterium]|nr:MAG: hypothetical protein CM1200mP26_29320 [Acidimicrobiales bacterium]